MFFRFEYVERQLDSFLAKTYDPKPHRTFSLLERFSDDRIGWHTRRDGKRIIGYYETGVKTRFGALERTKIWMVGKYNERKDSLEGVLFYTPFVTNGLIFTFLVDFLLYKTNNIDLLFFVAGTVLLALLFVWEIADIVKTYKKLKSFFDNSI